jgi:hypothetical protein
VVCSCKGMGTGLCCHGRGDCRMVLLQDKLWVVQTANLYLAWWYTAACSWLSTERAGMVLHTCCCRWWNGCAATGSLLQRQQQNKAYDMCVVL